jgi:hypothetical protein
MPNPLNTEVETVLRRIQQHVAVHATPFKKIDADNLLGRNSADVLDELVKRRLMRSLAREQQFVPTLTTLLQWDSNLEDWFNDVLGEARYEYTSSRSLLGVSEIIERVSAHRPMMLPGDRGRLEFYSACALPDFDPILVQVGGDSNRLATAMEVSADILTVFTLKGVRAFQAARAATKKPERVRVGSTAADPWERFDAPVRPLQGLLERLRTAGALSPEFAILLGRDAGEVGLCINAGATKAALILCGGILEGVLTSVMMRNGALAEREFRLLDGKQRRDFPEDASLPDLVTLARKELHQGLQPLLREVHEGLAGLINAHRDLVHPHAEIRAEQLPISEHTRSAVVGNLCALLEGIAQKMDAGWLKDYEQAG